jgi:hypothetical protein
MQSLWVAEEIVEVLQKARIRGRRKDEEGHIKWDYHDYYTRTGHEDHIYKVVMIRLQDGRTLMCHDHDRTVKLFIEAYGGMVERGEVYSPPYRPKRVREDRKRGREALNSIWQ